MFALVLGDLRDTMVTTVIQQTTRAGCPGYTLDLHLDRGAVRVGHRPIAPQ